MLPCLDYIFNSKSKMNALRNVRNSKELKVGRELLGRNMMRTRRSEPETLGWQKVMFTSVVM